LAEINRFKVLFERSEHCKAQNFGLTFRPFRETPESYVE
jgi:hypothetical protein